MLWLLLQLIPVEQAEHRNRSRWFSFDHVEPKRALLSLCAPASWASVRER